MEKRPVRATIIHALFSGLFFVPACLVSGLFFDREIGFRLAVWLCLAGYGWLLTRSAKVKTSTAVIPLLVVLVFVFYPNPRLLFFILAAGVLSWIRSGVCYPGSLPKMLLAEGVTCGGGVFLVTAFHPGSITAWALSIWLFFLFQSLYFLLFETSRENDPEIGVDPFDRARHRAEKILSGELH